jgi:hypothetical protein
MRSEYDVLRSLTRYVALALGPLYEVREVREEGAIGRPGAMIEMAAPVSVDSASSRLVRELVGSYNAYIYPELGSAPLESRAKAARIADRLENALDGGIDEGRVGLVPLWDFEGVPYDADSTVRRAQDFARIRDLSVFPKQAPDDENRFTVLAEVRLSWRRNRALVSEPRTTQSIRMSFG